MPALSPDPLRLWTAAEFAAMPEDHLRHELVRGELRTMPLASAPHGLVIMWFSGMLVRYVHEHDLGVVFSPDTGLHLYRDPDTVRAADISFLSRARIPSDGIRRGFLRMAPDLAVEVLSPDDTVFEIEEKIEDYFGAGSRLVWVINPKTRTATVYRPDAKPYVLASHESLDGEDVLPGFTCRVGEIFTWLDARGA